MIRKQAIKEFSGRIIGWISEDTATGDKTLTDFSGVILGYYRKRRDVTTDYVGREIYQGDNLSALLPR